MLEQDKTEKESVCAEEELKIRGRKPTRPEFFKLGEVSKPGETIASGRFTFFFR